MKYLFLAPILLLAACVSSGGAFVAPVYMQIDVSGEVDVGSIMVGNVPLTYPIRAWGEGTITLQYPNQPHVDFVGDGGWIIEPITPQDRAQVERLMAAGAIRGGKLVPSGTISKLNQE